ncbi:MAG TPA: 5'-nucleotidase [Gillisia sp.]|nr:5'-nucleotidase [Gillisia sp.]
MMKYKFLLLLLPVLIFSSCKQENLLLREIKGERIPVNNEIAEDTAIANYIRPFSQHINKVLDSVVAYNPQYLNKSEGELNTAIGNFMADVIIEQANPVFKSRTGKNIDMVILNYGGIRATIEEGPLTARTAYSIMPFENEIVVAELSGSRIKEMLTYLENNRTAHPVSGIKIEMNRDYKITNATIDGRPIDENSTYFVATSDYLQQGGDNMNFLKDPITLHVIDYKLRNAYIDYFNKIDTLRTVRDDRYIRSN